MDLSIEYVPINSVKPYSRNAKKHPAGQIEQIKASMREFGICDPIGVWHNEVVEGHGRLQAAKELGYDTIPVVRLDELTDEQRRAYALAHNKTAEGSDWDFDLVGLEINDLLDFDFAGFGFDLEEPRRRKKAENFTYRDVDPLPRLLPAILPRRLRPRLWCRLYRLRWLQVMSCRPVAFRSAISRR